MCVDEQKERETGKYTGERDGGRETGVREDFKYNFI